MTRLQTTHPQSSKRAPHLTPQHVDKEKQQQHPSKHSHSSAQSKKTGNASTINQQSAKQPLDKYAAQDLHSKQSNKKRPFNIESDNESDNEAYYEYNDDEEISASGKRPVSEPQKHKENVYIEKMTEE